MIPKDKHIEEKYLSLEEFERATEHPHKFFTILYTTSDGRKMKKEYRDKYNVKRILDSEECHDPKIRSLEIVNDDTEG